MADRRAAADAQVAVDKLQKDSAEAEQKAAKAMTRKGKLRPIRQ